MVSRGEVCAPFSLSQAACSCAEAELFVLLVGKAVLDSSEYVRPKAVRTPAASAVPVRKIFITINPRFLAFRR